VLFGWIIGNIATVVADFNQYETAYKLRMESIKTYLVHKKIPREMKKRVRKCVLAAATNPCRTCRTSQARAEDACS
jgi:hypothetical protein